MRFLSLKTKIVALCIFLSTVPTGLLGYYLVRKSYESLRLQAQQSQLALAKSLSAQIEEGISQAFQAVEVLSKRPEVTHMERRPILRELSLVTLATELLDALLVVLPDGEIFARSLPGLDPRNLPPPDLFRSNWQKVSKLSGTVLTDIYQTRMGEIAVAISSPIRENGEMKATLAGIFYFPNHTIASLSVAKVGDSGYAYLVNEDGMALVHPVKSSFLEDLSDNPAVMGLKKNKQGVVQFKNKDGREILAAYATVESASWGVIVRQPAEECYEPAIRMLKAMTFFLLLALIAGASLALWLSRRLVQPLLSLAGQVGKFNSGRTEMVDWKAAPLRDEVDLLGDSIGQMTTRLKNQAEEKERAHQRALAAEKKLSESERLAALGQLSAGLAHELNNPLAVILGSVREAGRAKGKKLKHWHGHIQEQAARCQRLVSELLRFARPIRLRLRKVDLLGLAQESWNQAAFSRGAEFHLEITPTSFESRVDPERFRQVFINLFSNALDAMPNGGKVSLALSKSDGIVRVAIRDHGAGFSLQHPEALFRPFYTTKSKGTGLGLSITRSILKAHGGSIWAEKPKGKGALFILEWPVTPMTRLK